MSFRLYDRAWVCVDGHETPQQAHRDVSNPGRFTVAGHHYDIDARALSQMPPSPVLLSILSLQAIKEAGLRGNGAAFAPASTRVTPG